MDEENIGKRNKMRREDGSEASLDRLSELPEPLLVQILSLLPMKDAVRTDVLSKTWKNLWNYVDKLVYSHEDKDYGEFTSFVDRTIKRCKSSIIKKFSLVVPLRRRYFEYDLLDKWLQWAYDRKVEILKVGTEGYAHPPSDWFYINSSLVELDMSDWDLSCVGPVVSWPSLKSLSLRSVSTSSAKIEKLLLGCPMLENLVLEDVMDFWQLNIGSSRLRRLSVISFNCLGSLKINAPSIRYLEISGYFEADKIQLINVSSLVEANLNFLRAHSFSKGKVDSLTLDLATSLLERLCNVKELKLGALFIQALSILKLLDKPCPSFKCKRLTISLRVLRYELPGTIYLLQNSPHLETLVIEMEIPTFWQSDFGGYLKGIFKLDVAAYLTTERVDLRQLTRMRIAHPGNECYPYFAIELAEYIVSNAHDLDELVITAANNDPCTCSRNCDSWYESLMDKLVY